MNSLVFNRTAQSLKIAIYGQNNDSFLPVATDDGGNFMFSPESQITVTASNLDIRDLTSARDTVNVTAIDFDIRNLNGSEDSVLVSAKGFTSAQTTVTLATNTVSYLFTRDIGAYSQNSFFLRNTSGGSVTVSVEIAPINDDDFYISSDTTSVSSGNNYLAAVATLMQYARLRVQSGGTAAGVAAYYNGRA